MWTHHSSRSPINDGFRAIVGASESRVKHAGRNGATGDRDYAIRGKRFLTPPANRYSIASKYGPSKAPANAFSP
jgi:hypothetical protein